MKNKPLTSIDHEYEFRTTSIRKQSIHSIPNIKGYSFILKQTSLTLTKFNGTNLGFSLT
jgi:hypothetical protein